MMSLILLRYFLNHSKSKGEKQSHKDSRLYPF